MEQKSRQIMKERKTEQVNIRMTRREWMRLKALTGCFDTTTGETINRALNVLETAYKELANECKV
jgi:hypothetical protein